MKKLFSCALDKKDLRDSVVAPILARLDGFRIESYKQWARISRRLGAIEDSIKMIANQLAAQLDKKNAADEPSSLPERD